MNETPIEIREGGGPLTCLYCGFSIEGEAVYHGLVSGGIKDYRHKGCPTPKATEAAKQYVHIYKSENVWRVQLKVDSQYFTVAQIDPSELEEHQHIEFIADMLTKAISKIITRSDTSGTS